MSNRTLVHANQHQQRTLPGRNGKPGTTIIEQTVFVYVDPTAPYPTEQKISLWPDRTTGLLPKPYEEGEYLQTGRVVSLDQYGKARFVSELKRVGDLKKSA